MQAHPEPLAKPQLSELAGLVLITEDSLSVATLVAQALQQKGATPVILAKQELQDLETITKTVAAVRQQHGTVTGIIHLAPLDVQPIPKTLVQWRQATQLHAKSLFYLLHLCATDLQKSGRVLAASGLGGYFGRVANSKSILPTGGASTGLLKTLAAEWNGVQAKAVDFDCSQTAANIAERVVQELLLPGGRSEVGYPQGNRTIFRTVPAAFAPTPDTDAWIPTADAVVLATGGARGITAEIVADLAAYGLTLIVTGQSSLAGAELEITKGITSVSQLRQLLIKQGQQQNLTLTPVQIERQLQTLLRDRTIRQNLEKFQQLGAKVEYLPTDVRDDQAFGNLIDGIYKRYGRLDAVIHGAGIIEDKLIADKHADSFDRVFDTKADSAFILSRHLRPESLKLLVFFTSVAGRYGNRGQADYAAANELVNRLAWQLHHQWSIARVVAINWGPWDTTGMASEAVKRQFRERGIIPIPLDAGRQFFAAELQKGRKSEVEVIAGDGPWEAYEAQQEQISQLPNDSSTATTPFPPEDYCLGSRGAGVQGCRGEKMASVILQREGSKFVLLSEQPQLQPNSTVTLDYTLSIDRDPYLQDHRLDGKPVMPATGALEWIAEFVQAGWPEWTVTQVQNLRVLRGLVLETSGERNIRLQARAASHADAESLEVSAEIIDPERNLPFYRATVILRPAPETPPIIDMQWLDTHKGLDPHIAYRDYLFHGCQFQLITAINSLNEQGIDALVTPSQISGWKPLLSKQARWLFDPGLLDTAPQLAIVWARLHRHTTALPSCLGSVIRYDCANIQSPLRLAFRVTQVNDHNLTYDALFFDHSGKVRLQMQQIESTCNSALNRLAIHP
ncbi:SDR family NAD(P)-dependent oxidoreductase [Nostoc sp. UHCC 0702]|nr:SDR family NAD(P)-dependent oxidoreductase [Nostoc sp. UHCC 0702]